MGCGRCKEIREDIMEKRTEQSRSSHYIEAVTRVSVYKALIMRHPELTSIKHRSTTAGARTETHPCAGGVAEDESSTEDALLSRFPSSPITHSGTQSGLLSRTLDELGSSK